jgi:hypothetical protein
MERIQVLLEKLQQQYQQKEDAASMLVTVQLLQNELMAFQKSNKVLGTSKVSVVMPGSNLTNPHFEELRSFEHKQEKIEQPVAIERIPVNLPATTEPKQEYYPQRPVVTETAEEQPMGTLNAPVFNMHINAVVEAPTLVQQQIHQEVNEIIAGHKESLNDRLKQEKKEIAHVLKDSPVKDLRKAIGVNDKFLFISELFRGDEAMYERSIKTINTFHILPEAEYWMNRELKVKLGWSDTKETVQHFYQLVRRRFS